MTYASGAEIIERGPDGAAVEGDGPVPGEGDGASSSPADHGAPDFFERSRTATVIAWVLFALVALLVVRSVLTYDFRDRHLFGDQSSFLLNAQSLAFDGHNLSYDAADLSRFRELGWEDQPYGLFFQRYEYGWAFAKPYGYSVWLAPSIRMFGAQRGMQVANLALLAVIAVIGAMTLRIRFRGAVVPLTLGAFLFGSNLFFYTYHFYTELFLVALIAGILFALVKGVAAGNAWWVGAGLALAAFLLTEKTPALLAVGPACVFAVVKLGSWKRRAPVLGVAALVFLAAVGPYLFYSSGRTWNPYGGERYYAKSGVPFGGYGGYKRLYSDETFSIGYARSQALRNVPDKFRSAGYYFVGRHTGVLPFMPLAALLLAMAVLRWRRSDGLGRAVFLGLAAYMFFYIWFFTRNYYGGGQSFGDRYFLQTSAAVLVLPVLFKMRARSLALASAASIVLALAFMWPHYHEPSSAMRQLSRTSTAQWILPFEANQANAGYFRPSPEG